MSKWDKRCAYCGAKTHVLKTCPALGNKPKVYWCTRCFGEEFDPGNCKYCGTLLVPKG